MEKILRSFMIKFIENNNNDRSQKYHIWSNFFPVTNINIQLLGITNLELVLQ